MMTNDLGSDFDWELVARYLGQTCSADEASRFEEWLAADGNRRKEFELIRATWARGASSPDPYAARLAWARVRGKLEPSGRRAARSPAVYVRAAAIACLLVGG